MWSECYTEYNPTLWFVYCEMLVMITILYLWHYLDNAVVGQWIPNTISRECIANLEIEATEYDKGQTNCAISGFNTFSGVKISLEENFYDKVYHTTFDKYNFYLRLLGLPLLRYFRYGKVLHSLYCTINRLYKLRRVVTNLAWLAFSLALPPPPQTTIPSLGSACNLAPASLLQPQFFLFCIFDFNVNKADV